MLKLALSFVLACYSSIAFAQAGGSLQTAMQKMGVSMKIISAALQKQQPIPAEDLKTAGRDLLQSSTEATPLLPSQIADASGQVKPGMEEAAAKYTDLMTRLTAAIQKLSAALEAGDNVLATKVLVEEVLPLRAEGHDAFRP